MERRDYPPPLRAHQSTPRISCPVSHSLCQIQGSWGMFSKMLRAEALALWGETEGFGLVQPEAEKSLEGPKSNPPVHTKGSVIRHCQNHHSTTHWKDKQQGTEIETRGSGWIQGYTSPRGESQALDQVTQWGCAAFVHRAFQDWSDRVPGDLVWA